MIWYASNNVVGDVVLSLCTWGRPQFAKQFDGPRCAVAPGACGGGERGCGDALRAAVACAALRLCRLCRDCPRLFATPPSAYAATWWRLGPFFMTFMRPCSPCSQPSLCTCSPALCRAFSYDWLSCCDCWVSEPSGCCMSEVEDFVKVNDPIVVLYDGRS